MQNPTESTNRQGQQRKPLAPQKPMPIPSELWMQLPPSVTNKEKNSTQQPSPAI